MSHTLILVIALALLLLAIVLLVRHQRRLKLQAYLMQEAIRNRDFSFRLPTSGLLFGERAMQDALNNIGQELRKQITENEVESWRKLTRVLTHEIMNATAPIASITQAFLKREDVQGTPIEEGIRAIHETSISLSHFVDNYRKFTQLQQPRPTTFNLLELADDVRALYPDLEWNITIHPDICVTTDQDLLRLVLINLIKNAHEAGARKIGLAYKATVLSWHTPEPDARPSLFISNDASPIPTALRADIFTPFFTTKRTGSGIGLSLSRQILVMQGGSLSLADTPAPGYHTTFAATLE